ncbi:MAG: CHAD domain-containing protein [Aquabacterium sp.]
MDPARDTIALELTLTPAAVPLLRRHLGSALGRARRINLTWHDRDGVLAARGIALVAWREAQVTGWRVEPLLPAVGMPPIASGKAVVLTGLAGFDLPDDLAPVQNFVGQLREGIVDGVALRLVTGQFDAAAAEHLARLTLSGPAGVTAMLAQALASNVALRVPADSLAAEAQKLAGIAIPPRPLGAPILPADLSPGDAFAHAATHLLGVVLHHAPDAAAGMTGEPVHQMRVALRRLRSLTGLFQSAIACPEVEALRPVVKALATALGPARDWDVFLAETGRAVAAAFPDEPAVATLIAAAERHRAAAYADLAILLAGPALHTMALETVILAQARPWPASPQNTAEFGASLLTRRLRRVAKRRTAPGGLSDAELHQLRLKAKRLRYAAEIFASLFPGRQARHFLNRVAALQQALGLLNDGVVAAALMQHLADEGGTGLAGGMVRGFVAAGARDARADSTHAWRRLRKTAAFWA